MGDWFLKYNKFRVGIAFGDAEIVWLRITLIILISWIFTFGFFLIFFDFFFT